jgi:AcrR family transcriptional regulator
MATTTTPTTTSGAGTTPPTEKAPPIGRDVAICDATLALLVEVGYDRMSMDAVAARAHASKATIYRRWPGKQELVLDAVRSRGPGLVVPEDTGSLRGDLVATYTNAVHGTAAEDVELIAGVLRAMRSAPELADCVRSQMVESKCAVSKVIIDRAIARGELGPGTDHLLLHEVAGALWFHRILVVGAPVDDAFIAHVVDDVLIPTLDRSSRSTSSQETP